MKRQFAILAALVPTVTVVAFMFDPITIALIIKGLLALGGAAAVTGTVIYIVRLTLTEVMNWFRSHRHLSAYDKELVGVTIKEAIQDGKYVIVQGIFNNRTARMVESRKIMADQIDDELARKHAYQKRVIYELS
jgi:hypothetical protein